MSILFDTGYEAAAGEVSELAPAVRRVTAPNSGPFTFRGTNTYLVGTDRLAVIDPGPDDDRHLEALRAAIGGRPVDAILVTHTHRDHTGLLRKVQAMTEAPTLAQGPHRAARALHEGERNGLDAAADRDFVPDRPLRDGERFEAAGTFFEAVATPGHTANHLAFALADEDILFSGDHVMGWSTTIVAPPDGSMGDFMRSLDKLIARTDARYLPGHGGTVDRPGPFLRGLRSHRRMRERAILQRLRAGDRRIEEIVRQIYRGTDPRLHGAAALSVLAHLEDLVERGAVLTDGPPLLGSHFQAAG